VKSVKALLRGWGWRIGEGESVEWRIARDTREESASGRGGQRELIKT